jgi:hypothetical protein
MKSTLIFGPVFKTVKQSPQNSSIKDFPQDASITARLKTKIHNFIPEK